MKLCYVIPERLAGRETEFNAGGKRFRVRAKVLIAYAVRFDLLELEPEITAGTLKIGLVHEHVPVFQRLAINKILFFPEGQGAGQVAFVRIVCPEPEPSLCVRFPCVRFVLGHIEQGGVDVCVELEARAHDVHDIGVRGAGGDGVVPVRVAAAAPEVRQVRDDVRIGIIAAGNPLLRRVPVPPAAGVSPGDSGVGAGAKAL